MIRNSCPPNLCSCWYAALPNKKEVISSYLAQLTPKQVQETKKAELLSALRNHSVSQNSEGILVWPSNLPVPYLCRRTAKSIKDALWVDIRQLRQYYLTGVWVDEETSLPSWSWGVSLIWEENIPDPITSTVRPWNPNPEQLRLDE